MKKLLICVLTIFAICMILNFVPAASVSTGGRISFVGATEEYSKDKSIALYGVKKYTNPLNSVTEPWKGYFKLTDKGLVMDYIKYIYRMSIEGYESFCLDPGKAAPSSEVYTYIKGNEAKEKITNLSELVAIYNMELEGKSIYYFMDHKYADDEWMILTINKDDEYIIKQLLMWIASAPKSDLKTLQTIYLYKDSEYHFSLTDEAWEILIRDICNAVLHNHQRTNTSLMEFTENTWNWEGNVHFYGHVEGSPYELNKEFLEEIKSIFVSEKSKVNLSETEIVLYTPKNTDDNQRFIGIYDPPEEIVTKYAVVHNKSGSKSTYENFSTTGGKKSYVNYNGYTCTGYKIYKSHTEYTDAVLMTDSITPSSSSSDTSYTFNSSNSYEYNVIEFIYKKADYNLDVQYYYKSAGASSYTKLADGETKKYSSGSKIDSVSIAYNDTYNSTLFVKAELVYGSTIATQTPSNGKISFNMPGSNATLKIYYQYGQVTVNKYIRYNDGSISSAVSSNTYNLTTNQGIKLDEYVDSGSRYYYFKYVNGSTTKYHTESGYNAGSTVTISKGKNNVTVNLYYGLRRIDYAHKIGDSTTLESGTIYKYNSWGSIPNLVSAKSTPLYWTLGNTYVKLNYVKGKYKNATTTVAESAVTYGGTDKGTEFTITSFGLDGLGNRDNDSTRIHFYYNVVDSTKVVVRHFVKQSNGTYALNNGLANSQTVVYNGEQAYSGVAKASYTIVNNKYSQRKSVVKGGKNTLTDTEISAIYSGSYSEIYEIDQNDKIIIDRSRVLVSDGTYYKCQGFKTKTTTSATNDLTVSVSGVNTTSSLRQTVGGTSGYVYIDYYYEPVTYSLYVSGTNSISNNAKLKYMPKAAGTYTSLGVNNSVVNSTATGANESANIAYVPVTENLKPYIVTDKFRVRTAKYGISLSGSTMVYNVSSYQTWSVSDDNNMASVGSVVGDDVKLVYGAGKGYLNVSNKSTLQNEIAATYNTVKNISGAFTGNATNAHTTFNSILTSVASAKTDEAFYANSENYNIPSNKYNGLRSTIGSINYKIYTVTSSGITSKTVNYTSNISQENSMSVNIYTPAVVGDATIKSINFVNHSNSNSVSIIQQGVTFNVTVSAKKDTAYTASVYNKITNTGKYIKYWYLMFDFDVTYGGKTYGANTPIPITAANNAYAETTISGIQAVTTSTDREIVESTLNHIKVIAGTANLPSQDYANIQLSRTEAKKVDTSIKHIDNLYIKQRTSASSPQSQSDGLGMTYDSYYLVSNMQENLSVGRIFDFEITDCLDVNFKDVFRILTSEEDIKNSTYSPVNLLTGTRYFSGIRRLMVTDSITSTTTNNLVNRGNIVSGSVTKILPLGPYKHTTNTYIKAVKLGYRFSFDLKTSGYYSPKENTSIERYVKITPSYYYISKDGKTYNDNIKLYYKNSSGKYIDFETSNYTIYYKPDDGYRNLYNSSTYQETDVSKTTKDGVTTLTSSLVGLKIGSNQGFTLSDTKSMTISDAGYLQAWYGEFKLPNSTIALAVDANGNVDINNPLTNGYVGVKFNIECIDTYTNNRTITISYNSQDKGLGNNQVNTSQWDYEGYLGFKESNIGKELENNINIQLENGVWSVDANTYKAIKGTVIFYDLDDRAANDYD